MPRIGLRNIKTAISVFLCCLLYIILLLIDKSIEGGKYNIANGWYTPFFAGIATAYSVYPDKMRSVSQAKNRSIASVIGGIFGIILIFLYTCISNKQWPNFTKEPVIEYLLPYLLVSFSTVLLIYFTVLIKQTNATFVAVLTFLSVTTNARGDLPFWQFGINRINSTIIGVLIALLVNLFKFPRHKNKNLLFMVGVDGLIKHNDGVSGYINYKLNSLIYSGANISIFTTKTPSIIIPVIKNVNINSPILCLNGAALYDINKMEYLAVDNIDIDTSIKIILDLRKLGVTPFIHFVKDNILYSYCEEINNKGEEIYFNNRKDAPFSSFIKGIAPKEEATFFMVIEKSEKIKEIMNYFSKVEYKDKISCFEYDCYELRGEIRGYSYFKIYSSKIDNLTIIKDYCKSNHKEMVAVASHVYDKSIILNSNIQIAPEDNLVDQTDNSNFLNDKSVDKLVKKMSKLFHKKEI